MFMDIVNLPFEEPLRIQVDGHEVIVYAFKTVEPCNVKFGIQAPRAVKVHREEVYKAILKKEQSLKSLIPEEA